MKALIGKTGALVDPEVLSTSDGLSLLVFFKLIVS